MGSKYISNDLMAEIVKKYGSLKAFADSIDVSYDTLYSKFSGRSEWKVFEAVRVAKALGLNLTEFVEMIGG